MNFAPTEEQQMVKDMVARFVDEAIKPKAEEFDRTHEHPQAVIRKLGEMGLMGVAVPTEYDGAGMDNVTYVMALIEISRGCASCGLISCSRVQRTRSTSDAASPGATPLIRGARICSCPPVAICV